jgi:hypothetical protein
MQVSCVCACVCLCSSCVCECVCVFLTGVARVSAENEGYGLTPLNTSTGFVILLVLLR